MFSVDDLKSNPHIVASSIEEAIELHKGGNRTAAGRVLKEGRKDASEMSVGYSTRLQCAEATAAIAEAMAALGFRQDAKQTFRRAYGLYANPPHSSRYSSLGQGWGEGLPFVEINAWCGVREFGLAKRACGRIGDFERRIYGYMDVGEAAHEAGRIALGKRMFKKALKTANKTKDRIMREVRTGDVRTRLASLPSAGQRARAFAIVGDAPQHVKGGNLRGIEVLLAGLEAKDNEVMHAAIDELADLCFIDTTGASEAIEALIDAAGHVDWYVRNKAIATFSTIFLLYGDNKDGRFRDRARAEDVILLALQDSYLPTRAAAAELVKHVRRPETTEALVALLERRSFRERVLKRSQSEEVRAQAAKTLGILGDVRAVPTLLAILQSAELRDVRAIAAEALGQIGDTDLLRPLAFAIDDDDVMVGHAAAGAFVEIERRAGLR